MKYFIFADIYNGSKYMIFAENEKACIEIMVDKFGMTIDDVVDTYVLQDYGILKVTDKIIDLGQ